MTKKQIFKGIGTAIITPMNEYGVDYDAFSRHIDWQINEGINALVVCGTTGEASTLTDEEHREVIRFAVKQSAGRVPIVAGTGSNDTEYAIDLTKFSADVGADGVLVVTPYYNKATQKGLIRMFSDIADCADVPVVLYNVPSRTGISIEPKTCQALSEHKNIVGLKEASGDISKIADIFALCGDNLAVYSGNDDQIVPILALGGIGCISVMSNIIPKKTVSICDLFFEGKIKQSTAVQLSLLPLIHALFCEVNPIPIKAACAAMGFSKNIIRSPLTEMEEAHFELLHTEMKKQGLVV